MYALRVEKLETLVSVSRMVLDARLSNDLRWLGCVDGSNILHHSTIVICFLIEVITKPSVNHSLVPNIQSCLLRQLNRQREHVSLVQHLQPLLESLFMIAIDLAVLARFKILPVI